MTGTAGRAIRVSVGVFVIGILAVEGGLLASHLGAVGSALAQANLAFVALAIAFQVVSWLAFAALPRQMLLGGGLRVPLSRLVSVLLVGNAFSASLPVGSAVASGYTFMRFRRLGASMPLAAWALVVSGLISSATLGALGVTAALVVGSNRTSSVAALVAVGITLAVAVTLRVATKHPEQLTRIARTFVRAIYRIRRRTPSHGLQRVDAFVDQLVVIRPRGRDWLAGAGFAAANWAADVGCFVLACRAAGITDLAPRTIVIAYAADAVVGAFQLIPGGIGLVEGALVLALVSGGIPFAAAIAAVVIYRVISFVLVTLVGWMVWFGQREPRNVAPDPALRSANPATVMCDG